MTHAVAVPVTRAGRGLALAVLCAGMLMVILDGAIVNVALPSLQRALGLSQARLAWVVNAYLIAFGGLLLLAGRLGDLIGRRRVFVAGLGLFTAASALCGLSGGPELLIAARFVQGAGGALASAVILGMVVTLFPDPPEQARAIGLYSAVAALGGTLGLLAGGLLVQLLHWRGIFFVNVPIGLAALALAGRCLPPERGIGLGRGADVAGAALITAALMLGVYAIIGSAQHGWGSPQSLGLGAAALALLGAFVLRQRTARAPLLPPRLLRSRNVVGANLAQALLVAGLFGFQFLGALYLQRVLGYGPLKTGLALLPVTVGIGALSLGASARLTVRFGARGVLLAGLALIVAGLALLARAPVDGGFIADVLPVVLLLGVGAGLALPTVTVLAMADARAEDSGLASGLVNTTQQVGGAIGLAVLAALATTRTAGLLAKGHASTAALAGGYRLAFATAAGLVVAAALVAATVLRATALPNQKELA